MSWLEALILGVIQGLTEFLPISSSGHLEIASVFFTITLESNILFTVLVHGATTLSTAVVFRKDIGQLCKGLFSLKKNAEKTYVAYILLSMIPIFFIGVFFQEDIEKLFTGNLALVGSMLFITGIFLFFTRFNKEQKFPITGKNALILGVAQAFAVLPGISRSGITLSCALLLKIKREEAVRFSFLMVIIPILGASFLKVRELILIPPSQDLPFIALLSGFLGAFVTGIIACRFMMKLVKNNSLHYFAIYCFILGMVTLIWRT